jgi:hypothetical protein
VKKEPVENQNQEALIINKKEHRRLSMLFLVINNKKAFVDIFQG